MAWLPGRKSTLAAFGQAAGAARAHNLRLEKAVLRVRCVRADLSEAVILEQANKLAQSGRESVFDVLDDFALRGAMGVPLPFEATKEGANSMNESKSAKQLFAESKANFSVINMVRDGAVLAGNRLELGDRPELVFAELRAAVDRAFSLVEKPTTEDQSTVHMTLDPALQLVSNEELRAAICDTVQQLKSGPFGQVAPKEVQERLQIHLDGLLKVEARRVSLLFAGPDVTAKPVEG